MWIERELSTATIEWRFNKYDESSHSQPFLNTIILDCINLKVIIHEINEFEVWRILAEMEIQNGCIYLTPEQEKKYHDLIGLKERYYYITHLLSPFGFDSLLSEDLTRNEYIKRKKDKSGKFDLAW